MGRISPTPTPSLQYLPHTHTLTIGVLNLSGAIAALIWAATSLGLAHYVIDQNPDADFDDTAKTIISVTLGIWIAISALYIIVASLLINGARTRSAGQLMPWIIWTMISLIIQIIQIILTLVAFSILGLIINIFWLVIGCY